MGSPKRIVKIKTPKRFTTFDKYKDKDVNDYGKFVILICYFLIF